MTSANTFKLVVDKKGKVKIRKPLTIYVFTDILIIAKILKGFTDTDNLTSDTDLLVFAPKNYKYRGYLELKEVIKRTQIVNLSVPQRNDLTPPSQTPKEEEENWSDVDVGAA